jgi:hypothetical protein
VPQVNAFGGDSNRQQSSVFIAYPLDGFVYLGQEMQILVRIEMGNLDSGILQGIKLTLEFPVDIIGFKHACEGVNKMLLRRM